MNRNRTVLLVCAVLLVFGAFAFAGGTEESGSTQPAATQGGTATGDGMYKEAPMLAELVKAGKLPPIEERLPLNPKLVNALPAEWLTPEIGQYGGTLRILSPNVQYDNDGYMMHVQPLLNTPGIQGDNITPNVLESFTPSADQKTFTMKLREGMRWSDGVLVTTEDVRFAWEDVWNNIELNPSGVGAQYRTGSNKDGDPMTLEIVDAYTFVVRFTGPYGGFPVALAIQSWRAYDELLKPRHYLEQFHTDYADPSKLTAAMEENKFETWVQLYQFKDANSWAYMNGRSLGMPKLTPWILVESSDERSVLERNPYYFKVDAAGNQLPYIDRIDCRTVADLEVLAVKQFAGEADYGAETVSINKLSLYKQNEENGNYNLRLGEIHRTSGVVHLNLTLEDDSWRQVVHDLRFRQALNMAIDRQEIIDAVYFGQAQPTTLNPNKYDPEGAKRLLDSMGMSKKDSDGFRLALDGKPFSIELEPHTGFFDMMPASELYAEFWNDIGIKTTIKNEDSGLWGERLNANQQQGNVLFDVSTLWYYQAYSQNIWAPLWNQWWNTRGEAGEEPPAVVKEFYEKVASIMVVPPSEGRKVAAEVEKMLYDNVWYFIPSIHQKQARIENKNLGNMTNNGSAFSIAQTLSMEQAFFRQ